MDFVRKKIMTRATTIFAPDEIPSTNGPAMGFSKKVCSMKPERDNAPPRRAAMITRGSRIFQMISMVVSFPSRLKIASAISETDRFTLPVLMFSTVITANAISSSPNTMMYLHRLLNISLWKLLPFTLCIFYSSLLKNSRFPSSSPVNTLWKSIIILLITSVL